MAHFAKINSENIVEQVNVVNNEVLLDENNIEQELIGAEFCSNLFGGRWVQTSYNRTFRKNFAGVGHVYNEEEDFFHSIQPYPSWELDENAIWQPPVAIPTDGKNYVWNEETTSWDEVVEE